MAKAKVFLIPRNKARGISEEKYNEVDVLLRAFNIISRVTYKSMYIIDWLRKDFLFVANNPLFLGGYTREDVMKMGFKFYKRQIPEIEQTIFAEINNAGSVFFNSLPVDERCLYTLSYDFNLLTKNRKTLLNHKITPILLDSEGKVWLAACVVSLSSRQDIGNVEMRQDGITSYMNYSFESKQWKKNAGVFLNDKERKILSLAARGFSMKEIAAQTGISINSEKFFRKNIFEKLEVTNITEAVVRVLTMS
jgi:DNA-binding CsgD family transcriptional regulator